jgi:hypothetical protein
MSWITQVLYWYEGLSDMVALPPAPTVPYGTQISVYVRYRNDGATNLNIKINLWLQSPDGAWRVSSSAAYLMTPGQEGMAYFTPAAVLNQAGTWNVAAEAIDTATGSVLGGWIGVLATVPAYTLAGRITAAFYWYEGLSNWQQLSPTNPPALAFGTPLHLLLAWVNDSPVSVRGHIDLTAVKPDSSQEAIQAVAYNDLAAVPGEGRMVQFAPIALEQVGSWTARAVLSGEAA